MPDKKDTDNGSDKTKTETKKTAVTAKTLAAKLTTEIETEGKDGKAGRKTVSVQVTVPGKKKGSSVNRKATAEDILNFRVHDDGKAATVVLVDGQRHEVAL